jgi:hypothetical protein
VSESWSGALIDRTTRPWRALLVLCVALVVCFDAGIAWKSTAFFGSGFNGTYADGGLVFVYFVVSALVDAGLLLFCWMIVVPVLVRLALPPRATLAIAGLVGVAFPVVLAALRFNLLGMVGRMTSVSMLFEITGGDNSAILGQFLDQVEGTDLWLPVLVMTAVALGAIVAIRAAREPSLDERERYRAPRPRRLLMPMLTCVAIGSLLLGLRTDAATRLRYGMTGKTSLILLGHAIRTVTDVDFDGYGWLSRPRDPAPFDGSISPYAIDVPGNGRDENGLGGDHPQGFAVEPTETPMPPPDAPRPHFLLVFLETFRADLLGGEVGGREVTPFLNRLAREGTQTEQAFAPCPSTVPSRAHLFTGKLAFRAATSSLIDDFNERGYRTGFFSGQDEAYGGSSHLIGTERADRFYDARHDVERRTSRSTSAVSLQVSWKTVLERVDAFLEAGDPTQPQFLYVNFTDTHFPYSHAEIDPILDTPTLERSQIVAKEAARIRAAYANTAANVDRAIERLVESFRARFGDRPLAILVTADHGQAFYEDGFLGHGSRLDDAQSRVPLILWGIGGEWPQPLGLSELRWLLRANLAGDGAEPARFVDRPGQHVLQWAAHVKRPRVIAMRGASDLSHFDQRRGVFEVRDPRGAARYLPAPESAAARLRLIWSWEAVQRDTLAAGG